MASGNYSRKLLWREQQTSPIWLPAQPTRPRDCPVTNVVAVFILLILLSTYLTRNLDDLSRAGK